MKIRAGLFVIAVGAVASATSNANAQSEETSATAGYWNYSASPGQPPVVNRVDQQSNNNLGDLFFPADVTSSATYSDPTGVIGNANANATIYNQSIVPALLPSSIAALLGLTSPSISLSTQATSTYPAGVSFNGNLPLASATAAISDSIKFCVASAGGCGALPSLSPTAAGYTLQVTVNYGASLQSTNGSNIGSANGTSMTLATAFDGVSGQTGLIQSFNKDFATSDSSQVFNLANFNPNDVNSFSSFSLLADISASPFSDGSEAVTFDDPITLTLLDSNGDVIPNLFVESQNGFFFDVTDGAATLGTSATPVPAALPLFATGLGGLGLLGWRRKRKARAGLIVSA
jgi:hypothetical protein